MSLHTRAAKIAGGRHREPPFGQSRAVCQFCSPRSSPVPVISEIIVSELLDNGKVRAIFGSIVSKDWCPRGADSVRLPARECKPGDGSLTLRKEWLGGQRNFRRPHI